ncbi:MAG: peptide chain release factor N(5)-glutamine methyltransferase [Chlamydiales bacterium]|nr:peptide chain release factor N(5)-glutamine methyltransferase [Chlamydiales bacterium]
MKTIREVLSLSTTYLKDRNITNPRREAEDLLCDALHLKRVELYMDIDRPLTEKELTLCRERLARRAKGEPLAYIHGEVDFADCRIVVNPFVLIPRPETELLVERVANALKDVDLTGMVLWDLCCGSGCIGIALKKKFPALKVEMSDISPEAVLVAKSNAEANEVDITIHHGDLFAPFADRKCHYFVCNPPYISEHEYGTLSREVLDHEPRLALVAELDGYAFYDRIARELPLFLQPGAQVWLELGYQQGPKVKELFGEWHSVAVDKDYSGHDRFVHVTLSSKP